MIIYNFLDFSDFLRLFSFFFNFLTSNLFLLLTERLEISIIQCVKNFWSDYFNLVVFGDFQNNCRPKNRNFQNCLAFGLVLLGSLKISIFGPNIILNIFKNDQISEPDQNL